MDLTTILFFLYVTLPLIFILVIFLNRYDDRGYFWGSLADRHGRRTILMGSLTVNGLGGLVSSTSQVFWIFLLARFISGIGYADFN